MLTVLVTAFGPYDRWKNNASWLALVELTRGLPAEPRVTTRCYPADFVAVERMLADDLAANYDVVIHLGQSPGNAQVHVEALAVNIGRGHSAGSEPPEFVLCEDGPLAYRSELPLVSWVAMLRKDGIPAQVSYHAGTSLCNAALYWTHAYSEKLGLKTRATLLHLPVDCRQVIDRDDSLPSLSARLSARAVRLILDALLQATADSQPRLQL